ncbi:MAG: FhaA domain-containing protein, partial [Phototrophicaceae bacterium]
RHVRAQDLALHLARAMEAELLPPHGTDPRPLAPDRYIITLPPALHQHLIERNPRLAVALADHLLELANAAGYRMQREPEVKLLADASLEARRFTVHASHADPRGSSSTAAMQPVRLPTEAESRPPQAQLIFQDQHAVALDGEMVTIGRHHDNHIVIDDPTVSRFHVQIRVRFGEHYIFNAASKFGTFVNGVRVKEHRLKPGDVIRLGNTQFIYAPTSHYDDDTSQTGPMDIDLL